MEVDNTEVKVYYYAILTTPFVVFGCHMCNNVTYPLSRRRLDYTNDQHLAFECTYYYLGLSMFNKLFMICSVTIPLELISGVC